MWHVKRAWLKNLKQKVGNFETRRVMMEELSAMLELRDMRKAEEAMKAFLSKWVRAGARAIPGRPRHTQGGKLLSARVGFAAPHH